MVLQKYFSSSEVKRSKSKVGVEVFVQNDCVECGGKVQNKGAQQELIDQSCRRKQMRGKKSVLPGNSSCQHARQDIVESLLLVSLWRHASGELHVRRRRGTAQL